MPGLQVNNSGKPYLRIVGGNVCQTVDKGTEHARYREYELSNGDKGSKYELVFMNWTAKIVGITFKDTTYGEQCTIELEDAFLSLPVSGRYFQSFATKVFSGDIKKEFTFHPYDIEDGDKKNTGISLQQDGEKLTNYFYDYEGKKSLHGFPEVDKEKAEKKKSTYWKVYFIEVADFLIEKLKELEFEKPQVVEDSEPLEDEPGHDLPF